MSDVFLLSVLRMRIDAGEPLSPLAQFVHSAREAAKRIEADAVVIERLRAELAELRSGEAHGIEKWRKLLAERDAQKERAEKAKAELAQINSYCAALTERMLEAEAAIPTVEQIEEIKRRADECMKEARWVGVLAQTHGGESDLHRANWKASDARRALHAALDALAAPNARANSTAEAAESADGA